MLETCSPVDWCDAHTCSTRPRVYKQLLALVPPAQLFCGRWIRSRGIMNETDSNILCGPGALCLVRWKIHSLTVTLTSSSLSTNIDIEINFYRSWEVQYCCNDIFFTAATNGRSNTWPRRRKMSWKMVQNSDFIKQRGSCLSKISP